MSIFIVGKSAFLCSIIGDIPYVIKGCVAIDKGKGNVFCRNILNSIIRWVDDVSFSDIIEQPNLIQKRISLPTETHRISRSSRLHGFLFSYAGKADR